MKFRKDFVTNSSSSSYLVAFDNDDIHKMIAEAWVDSYGVFETSVGTLVKDQDMLEEICSEYKFDAITKEDAFTALNDGKLLVIKNVGYDDAGLVTFLQSLSERDSGVVIVFDENN